MLAQLCRVAGHLSREPAERTPWHPSKELTHVQQWNGTSAVPAGTGPSVVTLGTFDGVHRGHRTVLGRVVEVARAQGASAVAVTFDPHPLRVLRPDVAPAEITTLDQRMAQLAGTGLDAVLLLEFTRELAAWSPERFVEEVLVGTLGASTVVVGRDTRFGHRNSGDVETLRRLGQEHGFTVEALGDLGPQDGERRWSSTWVRELLADGDVATAAQVLGRPHAVGGEVVHGDHRGRELGYPTANLGPTDGLVPADGIYAGWMTRCELDQEAVDRLLPVAVSIGTNPTFDGVERRVEAYVLDRDDLDLYGERVVVELLQRLRSTERFTSVEELVAQMSVDVERCRELLAGPVVPS